MAYVCEREVERKREKHVPPLLPRGLDIEGLVGGGHLATQVLLVALGQVALVLVLTQQGGSAGPERVW